MRASALKPIRVWMTPAAPSLHTLLAVSSYLVGMRHRNKPMRGLRVSFVSPRPFRVLFSLPGAVVPAPIWCFLLHIPHLVVMRHPV